MPRSTPEAGGRWLQGGPLKLPMQHSQGPFARHCIKPYQRPHQGCAPACLGLTACASWAWRAGGPAARSARHRANLKVSAHDQSMPIAAPVRAQRNTFGHHVRVLRRLAHPGAGPSPSRSCRASGCRSCPAGSPLCVFCAMESTVSKPLFSGRRDTCRRHGTDPRAFVGPLADQSKAPVRQCRRCGFEPSETSVAAGPISATARSSELRPPFMPDQTAAPSVYCPGSHMLGLQTGRVARVRLTPLIGQFQGHSREDAILANGYRGFWLRLILATPPAIARPCDGLGLSHPTRAYHRTACRSALARCGPGAPFAHWQASRDRARRHPLFASGKAHKGPPIGLAPRWCQSRTRTDPFGPVATPGPVIPPAAACLRQAGRSAPAEARHRGSHPLCASP